VGFLVGYGLGNRGPLEEAIRLRERERLESERAIARLGRDLDELQRQSRDHAQLCQILPDVTRQMFAVTGRRTLGPVALKMVEQLFHPEQCALFVARPAQRRLALAAGRGLPPDLTPGFELEYGQGRPGHVAETRRTMDDSDFVNLTSLMRRQVDAAAVKGLRADVVAPIEDEEGLMGILCMGGPHARHGEEKRLLKMVADLTSVALTHVTRLRTTEESANVDGLTGVYNKRYLQKRLGDELHRAEREQVPVSLLIIDVDHFKHYNDTNGHLAGDEVLKKVGQILKGSIREDDVAARYGGEEFVVVFPGALKPLAMKIAEGLRHAVERGVFENYARQPLGAVTISGGVATFPEDAGNAVALIRAADQALYDAKAQGRNRILPASPHYLT
jgi:diguanylate cyclase (GGDEF)-like protein